MMSSEGMFRGKRFLILEDEPLIALDIASEIEMLGGSVVADLRSVAAAERALDSVCFDIAVLDYKLSDGTSRHIGQTLKKRDKPFVFCTGGISDDEADETLSDVTIWHKPCDWPVLLREFARELEQPETAMS